MKFIIFSFLFFFSVNCSVATESGEGLSFEYVLIDPAGPRSPWAKGAGDLNSDGLVDIVIGGHQSNLLTIPQKILRKLGLWTNEDIRGDLVWYQNPSWKKRLISSQFAVRTSLRVADMNGDGHNDVVIVSDKGLFWLKNPGNINAQSQWPSYIVDAQKFHDVEVHDLDGDGDLDLVARNQSLFKYKNGDSLYLYYQDGKAGWDKVVIPISHGEGLKLANIDDDGSIDIVVNDVWLKNPARSNRRSWVSHKYTNSWKWQDVNIDVADVNNDGRNDIVLSPSEEVGQYYRISWFESPENPKGIWPEHIVDQNVEAVHHSVKAKDFNNDGYVDILTAEVNQSKNPDEVKIYLNDPEVNAWEKHVVAVTGSHNIQAIDIDNDFDMDFFGTHWQFNDYTGDYPVQLWKNKISQASESNWIRHVIDNDKPWKSVFVYGADIDGDNLKDIVTGGWWYKNPGSSGGGWQRAVIGEGANNAAYIYDFDRDGDPDILASRWKNVSLAPSLYARALNRLGIKKHDYNPRGEKFVWAQNDGTGEFKIHDNIEVAQGDFLQGVALLKNNKREAIALSWHKAGQGVQSLTVPAVPDKELWSWQTLSKTSQDEQVSSADIDADGDIDLLLGTQWLEKTAKGWEQHMLFDTEQPPDRNRLFDMNMDGRLDAIVGYEAISKVGRVAWYQQNTVVTEPWTQHIIGEVVGPMSLSVVDMDGDGDGDVLVGEHNPNSPKNSRLLWFENANGRSTKWLSHLIYKGDEHHDGAIAIDIDGDGDQDVLSIGWGHSNVLLYENITIQKD